MSQSAANQNDDPAEKISKYYGLRIQKKYRENADVFAVRVRIHATN
jgi:hypothetical protein